MVLDPATRQQIDDLFLVNDSESVAPAARKLAQTQLVLLLRIHRDEYFNPGATTNEDNSPPQSPSHHHTRPGVDG